MSHSKSDCAPMINGDCLNFGKKVSYHGSRESSSEVERENEPYVFLGGSCNPTTWRRDIAIPILNKMNIAYYNPQCAQWGPELINYENKAKEGAQVLLFVIDTQTRSVASMIEAAHIAGTSKNLILVIYHLKNEGCITVMGEKITERELEELVQGRTYLKHLVWRKNISVFDNIPSAIEAAQVSLKNENHQNLRVDQAKVLHVVGEKLKQQKNVAVNLDCSNSGEITIRDQQKNSCLIKNFMHTVFQPVLQFFDWIQPFCNYKDVYLGGSSGSWREDVAIPILKKYKLTYGYPLEDHTCSEKFLQLERNIIEGCNVLLFVITKESRSLSQMIAAAHYIGRESEKDKKRHIVLCIQDIEDSTCIDGEKLSSQAVKDYNRGRVYLQNIAKQADIFLNIEEAVEKAAEYAIKNSQDS
ncbi:uncharacterized protein LOC143247525 [Tachypleus tridentatus]|uniref:uncharacterized protein LOC143247525 n=1 Tax=Tachypleus tridentatus TaxID=6853 RepID=UPI003FCF14EB